MFSETKRSEQIDARLEVERILASIEDGRDSSWIRCGLRVLRAMGPSLGSFTTCDLWNALEMAEIAPPEEPRAMAVIITKARSNGWIESTSEWRTSSRKVNHGRPVRVWRWNQ